MVSATAGRSGSVPSRPLPVCAIALHGLPACTCPIDAEPLEKKNFTCPPITSFSAGAAAAIRRCD